MVSSVYVTLLAMIVTLEYVDRAGQSHFRRWFVKLATPAASRVNIALARLEAGNTSSLKSVGQGVHEVKIDFGPGYRVYVGLDGPELVILLAGSSKARQSAAIAEAKGYWSDYKARKRQGE